MGTIKKVLRRWREVSLAGLLLVVIGLGWSALRHDHASLEAWYPLLREDHAVLESWYPLMRDDHALLESWYQPMRDDHTLLEAWYQPMQDSLDNLTRQQDALANQLFEEGFPGQRELEANLQEAVKTLRYDHYLLETWYPGFVTKLDTLLARCPGK